MKIKVILNPIKNCHYRSKYELLLISVCIINIVDPSEAHRFDYERFFQDKIDKKKEDHTYRVFKKVSRRADEFPLAEEHTRSKQEIEVWCSNDYLGMTWHPKVQKAVM